MEIMEMKKKDLPNATAVLVLGILSLVFCWCYGFVGLVLGILAVAIASGPGGLIWNIRKSTRRLPTRILVPDGFVVLLESAWRWLLSLS